ncbi:20425_t:CDS:2 [Funneliformis geosporum]|uniref:7087_t:CDS:1 n=1 Tax=Funneliformis geosporum TaxID=1117311 RepID=A0A9W4WJ02_9GLOM|nr:20425_t:CDS:2 [Funneliformis geosporum]CAI2165264.1 7087_t:CDS:2 [Funneliformis geosporum]
MGNNNSSKSNKSKSRKNKQHISVETELCQESRNLIFHLPKNDQDIDRMQLQHFLFEHIWKSNYSSPIEHKLKSCDFKVLDVGCGPGTWLLEMSTQHPLVKFVGVDIVPVFPSEIKPTNLDFHKCDINQGLPFKDNYFDFVRMSLIATSLKGDQWNDAIRELVRVLKPNGYLEIVEKDLQASNQGPCFKFLTDKFLNFITSTGVNVHITQQIPTILSSIPSLTEIRSDVREIPVGPLGGKFGTIYEELLEMYIKNNLIDILPNYMCINEDQYLDIWKCCQLEFTKFATNYKLFRFWAQKVVDNEEEVDNFI